MTSTQEGQEEGRAAGRHAAPRLPDWFQTLGRGAWLLVGMAILAAITFLVLGLVSDLVIPLIFATILAAIFVPLVDRLERWRLPRWFGAPLVVVFVIGLLFLVAWMVVSQLLGQDNEVLARVTSGFDEAGSLAGVPDASGEQAVQTAGRVLRTLIRGVLAGLGSVTVLIVGFVTGLFILLFLMKDWQLVFEGASSGIARLLGTPSSVGVQIVSDAVHSFRSYAWGLTIIGLMNAVVMGLAALLLGVPLALPIAIVTLVTSYIPYFGAFVSGAFAVLIALGAQGPATALALLAVALLSNNTLQNLLEPVAFGRTLRLHPLVVMLVTTAGTLLFGVLGATLAAPLAAVTLRTLRLLAETGLFSSRAEPLADPFPHHGRDPSLGASQS